MVSTAIRMKSQSSFFFLERFFLLFFRFVGFGGGGVCATGSEGFGAGLADGHVDLLIGCCGAGLWGRDGTRP